MTDLKVELLPWQQKVYQSDKRFKVIAAGRRTGKSRLAAWMLILYGLQANKGHVFYVAPTQGQARDIMWQTLLEVGHPVVASSHVNNLQIKLVNGATISLKGADRPETMRGVSLKFLVMDEYADMKPRSGNKSLDRHLLTRRVTHCSLVRQWVVTTSTTCSSMRT